MKSLPVIALRKRPLDALLVALAMSTFSWPCVTMAQQGIRLPGGTVLQPAQPALPSTPGASVPSAPSAPSATSGGASQPQRAPAPSTSSASSARPRVQLVDSIAVVVNNEVITNREIDERMGLVEGRMRSQNITPPSRAEFRKQLLERMILDRAQLQLAKETGIRVDDLLLDRAVATIAEQNRMSLQEFRNQLERDGVPFARFREEIREEIVLQRLREREVDNKLQISESEVDQFLDVNPAAANKPELNIAHILIRIPENASAEQINQRRARAEEAVKQLSAGSDFAKVAASFSDATDGFRGGELGWRAQERLPELFIDAVAKSNPGELTMVKSASGFHILKLLGRRTAGAGGTTAAAAQPVQQTRARHILIKVNQVVSATEARRKLVEVRQRIENKASTFEEMAKLYSNDNTANKGGDLGWLYPGDTVPDFERAMNALKPGEVSEPIESPFGFHLIQVLERKRDEASPERQRQAARLALRERKLEEATEEWLRQLRDRTYVEYRDEAESRS